ncbi:MAG TPA: SGNH/GDSL hydrolase family protein [Humidesulfovibrio sp.]|uniref:SGNH/GDSL hydrolase family protein n=1 Tax=Humidesulfovibrio sp. TaxID=2910988 RepID=UPI002D0C03EE|nr:SGNH/GDSL hydrolase family protein [Humidesulfovibrio sp.]HWR04003.1 SGNH/GDSL hydrolase family protein [Humidesulfovibrio sp.]
MAKDPHENRFERNRKAVYAVVFSLVGLVLLGLALLAVKVVRDEVNRGYERFLIMREHRPSSDLSKAPSRDLLAVADGLEDKLYRLRADENGFIKPSAVHEKPDASVVFLGGSTTECHFMGEEERFPYLVGRQLEASLGKRINSYNGGYAGNNTLHCLLLLQGKVLPMKPRVAVLMECINDLTFLAVAGSYWSPSATRGLVQDKQYNLVKQWIIHNLIGHKPPSAARDDEFADKRSMAQKFEPEAITRSYRLNLEHFIFICRQHGITPVLMTQFNRYLESPDENLLRQLKPMFDNWHITYEQYRTGYMALNDAMRDVAREQKVQLIDLDRLVPKTKDYMYDVVHLNANGSRFVADVVSKSLEPVLR